MSEILSTASGYSCPKCGQWVSQGTLHACVLSYDFPQYCGHPRRYLVSTDEGTHYCLMCNFQAAEFAAQEARRILQAEIAKARIAALKEAAQIAKRYQENYPEDIFTTNGTSIDAQSARCMRIASDNIAAEIRKAAEETGVGLHAS